MPGRERQVLAERPAFGRVEALARYGQPRHGDERRVLLTPFDGRILDRHGLGIALHLDAEVEGGIPRVQRLDQVVTQEIGGGAVLEGRGRTDGAG